MGKSRKKSWKKIPRTADEELPRVHQKQQLKRMHDAELFEINDEPTPATFLTLKQKRIQAHRDKLSKLGEYKDVKKSIKTIAKRETIKLPSRLERAKNLRAAKILPTGVKVNLLKDPWAEEDVHSGDNEFIKDGKVHDLKIRGIMKPKQPKSRKYIPSLLSATKVANAGQSYNPEMEEYMEYANKIAGEEVARDKDEAKLNRKLGLPPGMKHVTAEEMQDEIEQGFFEGSTDEEDDVKDDAKPEIFGPKKQPKPKSDKLKKRQLRRKIAEMERKSKKEMTKLENIHHTNLKKLYKEIDQKLVESTEKSAERAATKLLDSVTKRKTLGRGKFERYEEPIALPNEIKGSLRLVKTEGSLMSEQLKSLQSRNILAIAGEKETRHLPKRLKRKFVEKRDVKEVTAESKHR